MINYLAKKLANHYIKKDKIEQTQSEMFVYCFELLISTVINLLVVIVIAVATQLYIESLIFAVCFMVMRGIAGGYHANRHLTCFLSLIVIATIFAVMYRLISNETLWYISIALAVIYIPTIAILSPIDSISKPLSIKEYRVNKVKSCIVLGVIALTNILLISFYSGRPYAFSISYPLFVVALLQVVGAIKNIRWKKSGDRVMVEIQSSDTSEVKLSSDAMASEVSVEGGSDSSKD